MHTVGKPAKSGVGSDKARGGYGSREEAEGDDRVLQIEGEVIRQLMPTVDESSPSCTGVALLPGCNTGNPPSWEKPPKVGGREGRPILRDCVRAFAINQLTST